MLKSKSPLKSVQNDGDVFKKELDAFVLECQVILDDAALKDRQPRIKKLETRCHELYKKLSKLDQKVNKITKGKEPISLSRFEEAKDEEILRVESFKKQLKRISEKLQPDDVEEDYFRKVTQESASDVKSGSKDDSHVEECDSELSESDEENEDEHVGTRGKETNGGAEYDNQRESLSPEQRPESRSVSSSKFGRLGLFRKSSKGGKDFASKPPDVSDNVGGTRTKKQKQLEKEQREHEKREKKKKLRLEKETKERGKNKKKENTEQEKKKSKEKGKNGKKGVKDTIKNTTENEAFEMESSEEEESDWEDSEEFDLPPRKPLLKTSTIKPTSRYIDDEEDEENVNNKKRGGRWGIFQRSKSQRKIKTVKETMSSTTKSNEKKGLSSKQEDKQNKVGNKQQDVKTQPYEEEEEDDDDDDDDDEDEEDEEEEDEETEEESEESEEEAPVKPKQPAKVGAPRRVIDEEDEEEEEPEEEEEEDEEYDGSEEDEEEEEEEDFEDELEETGESDTSDEEGMKQFEAVCDFEAEQPEDLSFQTGDVLTIVSTREDGWWMAEDEEGNKGLVPSTYLKVKKDESDYRDVQSPETDDGEPVSPNSGRRMWKGLRKAMNERPERRANSTRRGRRIPKVATSVTDVLTAMGAIPSGFRPSSTAKLLKDDHYTLCNFLKPELSESNLGFKDLFWSPHENQIRPQPVRIQKMLSITMVKNMPQVGLGIEIKSRHVRIAIFDGEKILSNIHTMQASWSEADAKTWKFSHKVGSMLPSILDGDCFVRTNYTEQKIGLLFELCLSYVRTKTGEKGEFSCGWVHLPLYDESTGAPIFNKVYELSVKGGTPNEQDVEVDPSISRKASTGKLRAMLTANKKPVLHIKLLTPTKEQKTWLDVLPYTLLSSTVYLPFLSTYRKLLADALLRDRIDLQNTDLIHSPFLANFPRATRFPDIMDALRMCWTEKKKIIKKPDRRDPEYMKYLVTSAFMESAYLLLLSPTLPPYQWADLQSEQDRWDEISSFMNETLDKGILHSLLAAGTQHAPFDMAEVTYDLLEAYNGKR